MEQERKKIPLQFPAYQVDKSAYRQDSPQYGKERRAIDSRPSRIGSLHLFYNGSGHHHEDEQSCAPESNAFYQFHLFFIR